MLISSPRTSVATVGLLMVVVLVSLLVEFHHQKVDGEIIMTTTTTINRTLNACPALHEVLQCAGCFPTCEAPNCATDCVEKTECWCEPGYVKGGPWPGTSCFPVEECPNATNPCPALHEVLQCAGCFPTCEAPNCSTDCVEKTECWCEPGYVKGGPWPGTSCFPLEDCFFSSGTMTTGPSPTTSTAPTTSSSSPNSCSSSACPPGEHLEKKPGCQPTCLKPDPKCCPEIVYGGQGICVCDQGRYRNNADGYCVERNACPPLA